MILVLFTSIGFMLLIFTRRINYDRELITRDTPNIHSYKMIPFRSVITRYVGMMLCFICLYILLVKNFNLNRNYLRIEYFFIIPSFLFFLTVPLNHRVPAEK